MNLTSKGREQAKNQLEVVQRYKRIFESDDGKEVLKDLFRNFNMMRSTYSTKDQQDILFNEGQRNVVIYILQKLKIDETRLHELINIANKQ